MKIYKINSFKRFIKKDWRDRYYEKFSKGGFGDSDIFKEIENFIGQEQRMLDTFYNKILHKQKINTIKMYDYKR